MERLEPEKCSLESTDSLAASEAFSLIGNETRVTILEALWQAESEPVSFSSLYELAETDNSAQFNYHLNELTGHYIRKTSAGYELRTAGESVVRSIIEGSFTAHPDVEPIATGDDCLACGTDLVAIYEDEKLGIRCPSCDRPYGEFAFPPGALLDREEDEILRAFDQHVRFTHALASEGVCPECGGQMAVNVQAADDWSLDIDQGVVYRCRQCQHELQTSIGLAIREKAPVIAFLRDSKQELRSTPYWQLAWCVSDESAQVTGGHSPPIEVSIPGGDRILCLTLDRDLDIRQRRIRDAAEA